MERDVATAILMGGRLEIRKNIPRKLMRIRKPVDEPRGDALISRVNLQVDTFARPVNRNNFQI